MSNVRNDSSFTLPQKVKVLTKLYETGCKDEKGLQSLSIESILQIKGITIAEMTIIMELQKHTRNHTLYSYLTGGMNGKEKESGWL